MVFYIRAPQNCTAFCYDPCKLGGLDLRRSGGETRALPEGFDAGAAARCRSAAAVVCARRIVWGF